MKTDSPEGITWLKTHNHNTEVLLGGLTYARVIEILEPYTVTFEDGQYAVNLVGANSNVGDKVNVNQVSVRSANSAGLISSSAIEFSSFNSRVSININSTYSGTMFPIGTEQQPVNNLDDALLIAQFRGLKTLYIMSNFTISTYTLSGYNLIANNSENLITIDGVIWNGGTIHECTIQGTFANGSRINITNSKILNLNNITLEANNCYLSGVIELNNSNPSNFYNCVDGIPGSGTPIIQVNDCENLGFWGYFGGLKLVNITSNTLISCNINSGRLIVDSTCVNGSIILRGIGSLSGTSGGTIIDSSGLLDKSEISNTIWNEQLSGHTITGSAGKTLTLSSSGGVDYELLAQSVWNELLSGHTTNDSAAVIMKQIASLADELHKIQGLDSTNPMNVTPTKRTSGGIVLDITGDGKTTTTVTRQ